MAMSRPPPKPPGDPARRRRVSTTNDKIRPPASRVSGPVGMVRELAGILTEHGLSEITVSLSDVTFTLRAGAVTTAVAPMVATQAVLHAVPTGGAPESAVPVGVEAEDTNPVQAAEAKNGKFHVVESPFVGTFYRSPSPDADPFVEVGQRVEKGQILCIVEAMKLMNEIEADHAGIVAAVLVENAQSVEYGQPLFKISES
jgi:acetyl-CoA carboxylase biotin carboxyl carrier protein